MSEEDTVTVAKPTSTTTFIAASDTQPSLWTAESEATLDRGVLASAGPARSAMYRELDSVLPLLTLTSSA